MPVDFELSDPGSGRDNRCPVQWEDASFMERHSKWLAFENAYDSPMPELSLMDLGLDPSIGGLSDSPEIDAIYKLQPSNIAAQDFKPTPMSFKLETELPWIDLPISPRPSTQSSSVEPVSPRFSPAEEMQGLRKEKRRAQNRKAQREFRARKDKSLRRLQIEVENLTSMNQSLSVENEARLREISELKAELELQPFNFATSSNSLTTLPLALKVEGAGPTVPSMPWRERLCIGDETLTANRSRGAYEFQR